MKATTQQIDFTRINNDVNGNPRYVCHFLNLIGSNESFTSLDERYSLAIKRSRQLGGKKYHNKTYGGGIVFQSYNIGELSKSIQQIVKSIESKLK